MSNRKRFNRRLGIPRGLSAELRMVLAAELQRMGSTYREIAHAVNPPLTPVEVLAMARAWNSSTPSQQAACHDAARKENMRGGHAPWRN